MINLQLEMQSGNYVETLANVIFDTVNTLNGNIDYDTTTGIITFNEAGTYKINWWIASQSSLATNGSCFSFVTSDGESYGNSPIKTDQVSGVCLINITSTPMSAILINQSTETVYYSQIVPTKALMVIEKVYENNAVAIIPYAAQDTAIGVLDSGIYMANFGFSGSANTNNQYNAPTLPETISGDPEMISFSIPVDGTITNIAASYTGSGQIEEGNVSVRVVLYESDPSQSVFHLINASLTILNPAIDSSVSSGFTVSGTQTINYPVSVGTRIAILLFVVQEDGAPADTSAQLIGSFSGGVSISF